MRHPQYYELVATGGALPARRAGTSALPVATQQDEPWHSCGSMAHPREDVAEEHQHATQAISLTLCAEEESTVDSHCNHKHVKLVSKELTLHADWGFVCATLTPTNG